MQILTLRKETLSVQRRPFAKLSSKQARKDIRAAKDKKKADDRAADGSKPDEHQTEQTSNTKPNSGSDDRLSAVAKQEGKRGGRSQSQFFIQVEKSDESNEVRNSKRFGSLRPFMAERPGMCEHAVHCGMACYHVVTSNDSAVKAKTDKDGV